MQKKQNYRQQNAYTTKAAASQNAFQSQLAKAYALHQQGQLNAAKIAYLEALKLNPQNFDALQLIGTLCVHMRQSAEALAYFDKAIGLNAKNPSVFNNRGIVLMDLKNPALAIQSYEIAISLKHDYPEAHANKGNALQATNHLAQAIASYKWAIALRPEFADTYNNCGVVLHRLGDYELAIKSYTCALKINPNYAQAYYNAARVFKDLGDLATALRYYNSAVQLNSNYLDAYNNKGNILLELKDFEGAIECFDKGLEINANAPQLHNNKGNVYRELKRFDDAVHSYARAIQIYPKYADAHNNLGNVFQDLKRFNDALICYDQALAQNPHFVDALNNKGVVLRELKRPQDAVFCYKKALLINPQFAQGYFNLGNALKELDSSLLAQINYQRALAVDHKYQSAKWAIALLNIPTYINSNEQLEASRVALNHALITLEKECSDTGFLNAYQSVGVHQPFYLAYQERNNKELMMQYGQICHKVMTNWESKWRGELQNNTQKNSQINQPTTHNPEASSANPRPKIKLGIFSDQIRYHSVWNAITKGLVEHLNPENFEIHIFYLGTLNDEQTDFAKSKATSFTQNLPTLKDWANSVLTKQLDALLYPEIGMHALTLQLAHLRLAPLQMVSWGHPHTTGIETIDYFISSEDFEDSQSQNAYSEKLFNLPSLGCTYAELQIQPETVDLIHKGVGDDSVKLLCPGALFKYSPEYDWTFAAIAKALKEQTHTDTSRAVRSPKYQFLFLYRDAATCELFKKRLEKSFESNELDISEWVVFLPWMNPQSFYALMHACDLFLDTLGFSGFNTAMQAVECGLPIVAKSGRFLRGRFASAILNKLDLKQCIASSDQEYVDQVVKLASNPDIRATVRSQGLAQRHILFNDLEPVRAFEKFLASKCH